jgi:hypothetical protein
LSSDRKTVRATLGFFDDLDRQLTHERGPNGEPSVGDFQVHELLLITERFALDFDQLPLLIPGRSDYRILIATGKLIVAFSVVGQLMPDGAIELLRLDLDTSRWP